MSPPQTIITLINLITLQYVSTKLLLHGNIFLNNLYKNYLIFYYPQNYKKITLVSQYI